MAIKKSQIYSSLWQSCDALRGGMDASQYKDYVLTLLFMKYVSDKHAGDPGALIEVPEGGGFTDMVKLKGDKEIGDKINKIIAKLADANDLKGVIDQADFNDDNKLGSGKDMQDKLSKLVAIFEDLDLSANRAGGDDLLGDAYEYLMTNFATESGKSKGQFYTPAEVSRVMAKVVGVGPETRQDQTIYDPTCGSGSLLLRAADEASRGITIYGQEMDNATWSLARMNMFLHGQATAELWRGNTLAAPYFKNTGKGLKTFDFAVANPPFSLKDWSSGLTPTNDDYRRFEYGVPPPRNGDYAFLLHLVSSLNSRGKGAIILPHGVLFRGNREAGIRRNLLRRGLIKGVIGLPANLFFGTGIPACILIIDKENAHARTGVFMIDASRGFTKDGSKNRLREQDIHKVVDTFKRCAQLPRYSRMVPISEIAGPTNDYNLNIPRYIDPSQPEDLHDLDAHLNGGIPDRDIDALESYWTVFPTIRPELFESNGRPGYSDARIKASHVDNAILGHGEFQSYCQRAATVFQAWCNANEPILLEIDASTKPKSVIEKLSEDLLARYADVPLLDPYDVYQRLMDFWKNVMQDDVYLIAADGWSAGRILRPAYDKELPDFVLKKGRKSLKYVGDLIPASFVIARFFNQEHQDLGRIEMEVSQSARRKEDFEADHAIEGGALYGIEGQKGVTIAKVTQRAIELKETIFKTYPNGSTEHEQAKKITKTKFGTVEWTKNTRDRYGLFEELDILYESVQILKNDLARKADHKHALDTVHESVIQKYAELTESEIKTLVVKDKWFASLRTAVEEEERKPIHQLARRVGDLEARYDKTLTELERDVDSLTVKVKCHLKRISAAYG